jgi:hypothetical protein
MEDYPMKDGAGFAQFCETFHVLTEKCFERELPQASIFVDSRVLC